MQTSKHVLLLALLLLGVMISCEKKTEREPEDVMVVQAPSEPRSLHPIKGGLSTSSGNILMLTSEALTNYDAQTAKLSAQLASLPVASDDFKSFTYTIFDEATWNDGKKITGEDVLFSLKAI
ncbi:MAG: hypothetical protein AB8F95_07045, partial [Bacteroidia bacterium]